MQINLDDETQDATELIGVLFNRFVPLFTAFYSDYAKLFDDVAPLINQYKKRSKEFTMFMEV